MWEKTNGNLQKTNNDSNNYEHIHFFYYLIFLQISFSFVTSLITWITFFNFSPITSLPEREREIRYVMFYKMIWLATCYCVITAIDLYEFCYSEEVYDCDEFCITMNKLGWVARKFVDLYYGLKLFIHLKATWMIFSWALYL